MIYMHLSLSRIPLLVFSAAHSLFEFLCSIALNTTTSSPLLLYRGPGIVDQSADPNKQYETRRDLISPKVFCLMFELGEGEKQKQKQKERILGGDVGGRRQGERRGVQAGAGSEG